jgi:uncharacterized protein (DUF924 family)
MSSLPTHESVIDFWFGDLDEEGLASPTLSQRWWQKDSVFDELIRTRFAALRERLLAGECSPWLALPHGRLAAIIVLDQLSRNMYRDTPDMYAADPMTLRLVEEGLALGQDRELETDPRVFFYVPLMHQESLAAQNRCVELLESFLDTLTGRSRERVAQNLKFAIAHRDIVARFGRFPHRNTILSRESTPSELEFLRQPGSSF